MQIVNGLVPGPVAMTSSSPRSNGSVPWSFASSAALVSPSNCACFPSGALRIGGVHSIDVLHDREPGRSERVDKQKRARVSDR